MQTEFSITKTTSDGRDYDRLHLLLTIDDAICFDALFEELEKAVQDIKGLKTYSLSSR